MLQIPCKMTGSSSKLLQIQGKWYQERMQKKKLRQKKQKLFYTHLFMSNLGNFLHICSCHFCVCHSICLYFRYQSYFLHVLLGHKTSFNTQPVCNQPIIFPRGSMYGIFTYIDP